MLCCPRCFPSPFMPQTFVMSGKSKSGQNCAFVEYETPEQAGTVRNCVFSIMKDLSESELAGCLGHVARNASAASVPVLKGCSRALLLPRFAALILDRQRRPFRHCMRSMRSSLARNLSMNNAMHTLEYIALLVYFVPFTSLHLIRCVQGAGMILVKRAKSTRVGPY